MNTHTDSTRENEKRYGIGPRSSRQFDGSDYSAQDTQDHADAIAENDRRDWIAEARKLGREAGENAGSWTVDGNSDVSERRRVLDMLNAGDPEAWDCLPSYPNLSGEYADDPTPRSLFVEVTGLDDSFMDASDLVDELSDAWEEGVSEMFETTCARELFRFCTTPQSLAREAVALSERRTRENGSTFYVFTTDDASEWVRDLVHEAHGDLLPDDYRFAYVVEALESIRRADAGADLERVRDEFCDDVDVYTSDLCAWLSSHLSRPGFCDAAEEDSGPFQTMDARLMAGQYAERSEVFASVLSSLEARAEEVTG